MNPEKLAKLQAQMNNVRIGGKGTPRRKMKKAHKPAAVSGGVDDKKLQGIMKKLNVQNIPGIEEVNMFKTDGSVLHFSAPRVQASIAANTFVIHGLGENKDLTELVPGILSQLGPDSLNALRKLAEQYQKAAAGGVGAEGADDVPELVENFDETD